MPDFLGPTLTHKSVDLLDVNETSAVAANARVLVRKNTGSDVGPRRRLNFVEGTGVTITVTDVAGSEEVIVNIAASGGSASLKTASIPFVDKDTLRRVSISDGSVTSTSKILACIQRPSGVTYDQIILAEAALKAYWRLGETVGTNAADSKGTATGTYTGGYTQGQTGAVGDGNKAVLLNGSTGRVTVPDSGPLDLGDTFSLEAWVKRTATGAGQQDILSKGANAYGLSIGSAVADKWTLEKSGVTIMAESSTTLDTGWHHLVATKSAGNGLSSVKLYQDGVDVTVVSNPQVCADNAVALALGSDSPVASFPLNATLDEVALYNDILSPTDVLRHYAARNPLSDASDYGYLYTVNVVSVYAGGFDVIVAVTDGDGEPTVPPDETVTLTYILG